MIKLNAVTAARAYLIGLLLLTLLFGSPIQLSVAVALLAIQLYSIYKLPKASLNLALTLTSVIVAPVAFEALTRDYAFLLVIPALFLLDQAFKLVVSTQVLSFHQVGRRGSDVLKITLSSVFLVLFVSVIVWNMTLAFTATVMLGFTGLLVAWTLRRVPKASLVETKSWSRIVAGDRETKQFAVTNQAQNRLFTKVEPVNSWAHISQSTFSFSCKESIEVSMWFTPPLAGPSKIQLKTVYTDIRGLVETGQLLEPLSLHTIPRAKYAQWLANRYLEQTALGEGGFAAEAQRSKLAVAKHGVEFQGSRPYQAGDRLKDIDWKHSHMLGELIVKEFSGAQRKTGIIVADLTAKDVEDADRLAYNLVMSALTLATESLPSALAVHNEREVVAVSRPMNPRETLKKAMALTEKIAVSEPKFRVLQSPEFRMLKRSIDQLDNGEVESNAKLSEVLKIELLANEEAAKTHPATLALTKAIEKLNGPAMIVVVSSAGSDFGGLSLTLERLKEKGFSSVYVRD